MIFTTMQKHAEALIKSNSIGTECFVLDRIDIDFDALQKKREEMEKKIREKKSTSSKLNIPVLFFGKMVKASMSQFAGNNPGNASKHTFQKLATLWSVVQKRNDDDSLSQCPYPEIWFPWLYRSDSIMQIDEFLTLLHCVVDADEKKVEAEFEKGGSLLTLDTENDNLLIQVEKSTCFPITSKAPTGMTHAILAFHALNIKYGNEDENISVEALRFCLLIWMLDAAKKSLKLKITDDSKLLTIDFITSGGGTAGDISKMNLLIDSNLFDHYLIGCNVKADRSEPTLQKYRSIVNTEDIELVKLCGKPYTAPATGISPTNAYKDDGKSALHKTARLGFNPSDVLPLLDGYDALLHGARFSAAGVLQYYIFPEKPDALCDYVEYIRDFLVRLRGCRDKYFDLCKSKKKTSPDERKVAFSDLHNLRKSIWGEAWNNFPVTDLIFAVEEDVGSANQPQNTWTMVCRNQPLVNIYLLLYLMDDPIEFGRLMRLLKSTSHNLGSDWETRQVKALLTHFFESVETSSFEFWFKWRSYLTRTNVGEDPIRPDDWENGQTVIMAMNAIKQVALSKDDNGFDIIQKWQRRREKIMSANREKIQSYMQNMFLLKSQKEESEKAKMAKEKVEAYIDEKAKDYARFVDVSSADWKAVVDGLLCGWALKQICRKLRENDYESVIGGRSLVKQSPTDVRTLAVSLQEKAKRAGTHPWNVGVPIELMFKWSLKNAYSDEVTLFMDSLSLGFHRFG